MADDKSKQVQKTNQNGRPTLVLKREHLEKTAEVAETASDFLGQLTTGAQVWNRDTFYWDILNSPSAPMFSRAWLNQVKDFRLYRYNPETDHVFQGNQHTRVTRVKNVLNSIDKAGGTAGNLSNGVEFFLALKDKDAKALAEKSSTMVLESAGETAGMAIAGRCAKISARRFNPSAAVIAGATCYVGLSKLGAEVGKYTGEKVGQSEQAIKGAASVITALEKLDKQEQGAEEKRKQREIKKEPMREWQIQSSD